MLDRNPISTAPRDGTPVILHADGARDSVMRWNPNGLNADFGIGVWEALDGSFTWSDGDYGPEAWSVLDAVASCQKAAA